MEFKDDIDVNKFREGNFSTEEKFSVKFPAERFNFDRLSAKLQKILDSINEYNNGMLLDIVKGNLTKGVDENGREYYEFSGTQRVNVLKIGTEKIRSLIILAIEQVIQTSGYNVLVEFNDCSVIVEDLGMQRERERTSDWNDKEKKPKGILLNEIPLNYKNDKKEDKIKEIDDDGKIIEPGLVKDVPEIYYTKTKRRRGEVELER